MARRKQTLGDHFRGMVLSKGQKLFVIHRYYEEREGSFFDTDPFTRKGNRLPGSARVYLRDNGKYRVVEPEKIPESLNHSIESAKAER